MTFSSSQRILGVGCVTVDHVLTVAAFPRPDSKNDALAARFQMGGPVPIALAQLRRLGHTAHLLSTWGNDPFGSLVEQRLCEEGITFFEQSCGAHATSVTQIWLEVGTGQRTLVTSRVEGTGIEQCVTSELLSRFDAVHLDGWGHAAALQAAKWMKSQGGLVSIDTGSPKPGVEELLQLADVVNCPKRFCEQLLNEADLERAAVRMAKYGARVVTVTDGAHGAVLHAQGRTHFQPALELGEILDTNGAGDSFSGALLHGVLNAWDPETLLRFASTCASLKCTRSGNQSALPIEQEIRLQMNQAQENKLQGGSAFNACHAP